MTETENPFMGLPKDQLLQFIIGYQSDVLTLTPRELQQIQMAWCPTKTEYRAIDFDGIPEAMRNKNQWLLWRLEGRTETFKGTKRPYANNKDAYGAPGSSTDPATWGNFKSAKDLLDLFHMSGIGFVLTKEARITVIDIDDCIEGGIISDFAYEIINRFEGRTYIELSASTHGLHIFSLGTISDTGGKRSGIELYDTGRYMAVTGWRYQPSNPAITDCQDVIDKILIDFPKVTKSAPLQSKPRPRLSSGSIADALNLRCQDLVTLTNARETADAIQGAHPVHGSETGKNFSVNKRDNVFYCFRHGRGGDALQLYAMVNGIIRCDDVGPGALDGKWSEVFTQLKKDGYDLEKIGVETPRSVSEIRRGMKQ